MKRVMIVGGPCSGKSTMAVGLGQITGLPVFHMDHVHYKAGWVEREMDEKLRLAAQIHARDRWVFEGGLSQSYAERTARADTVIWLDLPLRLRYGRVVKRRFEYSRRGGRSRADVPDDCPERLDPAFLAYMFRTRNSARAAIAKALSEHPQVHHIRTAKGVDTFLDWCRLG